MTGLAVKSVLTNNEICLDKQWNMSGQTVKYVLTSSEISFDKL